MTTLVSIPSEACGQATLERSLNPAAVFPQTMLERGQAEWALTALKERLLRTMLPGGIDGEQTRLLRLAAGEAEALAWLTPFPHLFLPVLLEEKVDAARQYVTRQGRVRLARPPFSGVVGMTMDSPARHDTAARNASGKPIYS